MKQLKRRPAARISEVKMQSQLKLATTALREVLCAAFGSGKPADRAMSGFFRENRQCGSRDRQFISEVVFAVFRNWGIFRKLLPAERRAAVESGEAGPGARELEMLVFGAIYLEPIEFDAAKIFGHYRPKPAADGGLIDRGRALLAEFDSAEELSDADLMPSWVAGMLPADFPLADYAKILRRRPPMWLRAQTPDMGMLLDRFAIHGLTPEPHSRIKNALALRDARVNLFTLEEYRNGLFEVQDLASQVIGLVAAPKAGERWLDACAGAGGKTLQLADLMQRKGKVVASDVRSYKLEDLRKRARRAGFPNIMTREWDGKPLRAKQQKNFDGVLVDAPCSCSGVWRRNPDGRWTLRPEAVAETALIQKQVLDAASTGVRPGGVLIYATCSIFPAENGDVVNDFVATHPDFTLESFVHPLTGAPVESGMLQVLPGDGDCDGMFVARMRRAPETEPETPAEPAAETTGEPIHD